MRIGNKPKSAIAGLLAAVMTITMTAPAFAADSGEQALIAELAQDTEKYPEGAFEFYTSQLDVNEGDGSVTLDIVRRGNADEEASVEFKAVDVTAKYGEDYTMSVKEGIFFKSVLEKDADAQMLAELYAEELDGEEVAADDEQAEQAEDNTAEETEKEVALQGGLRMLRNASLGVESDRPQWTDMSDDDAQLLGETLDAAAQEKEYIEQVGNELPGTHHTLKFGKGEYKKTVTINIIDDDISETDEQAIFMLYDAVNADIAANITAYLNIKDNDDDERVVFSMPEKQVVVSRDDEYAYVKVDRISGAEKFASVVVSTGAIDAVKDVDYTSTSIEVVFPQGVMSKTVKIPVLPGDGTKNAVSFAVGLENEDAYVDEENNHTVVTILGGESTEEIELLNEQISDSIDLMADEKKYQLYSSNSQTLSTTGTGRWPSNKIVENADLFGATKLEVEFEASGESVTSYEEKVGCKKYETKYKYYPNKYVEVWVNGKRCYQEKFTQKNVTKTATFDISEDLRKMNSSIMVKISNCDGNTGTSTLKIKNVRSVHKPITFSVDNSKNIGTNYYTEKIYDANGSNVDSTTKLRYNDGNEIKLGETNVSSTNTSGRQSQAVVYRGSDNLSFNTVTDKSNKNSNGVSPMQGTNGNIYLAGYQLKLPNSKSWSEEIILPKDMTYQNIMTNYKKYLFTSNDTFVVRPVLKPYTAVMQTDSDSSKGSYTNFANGGVYAITQLDTVNVNVTAASGYAVKGFDLKAYRSPEYYSSSDANTIAQNGNSLANVTENTDSMKKHLKLETSCLGISKTKVDVSNKKFSEVLGNVITFTPTGDSIYIDPIWMQPKITVKIDPKNNDKDKGSVIYSDVDNPENSKEGNKDNPMEIAPVTLGETYTFNAVTDDGYRAYWKDWTGDADGDGVIAGSEASAVLKEVENGYIVRTASGGNAFAYNTKIPNALIYYGFNPVAKNKFPGIIMGVVEIEDYPVFGGESTITPVNGATVYVDDMSTLSDYDADFGGSEFEGGDGFFKFTSSDFVTGENHNVVVKYDTLTKSFTAPVNTQGRFRINAYDTFSVINAKLLCDGSEIGVNELTNGDYQYEIELLAVSDNDALNPVKAEFSFYREDGSYITSEVVENDTFVEGESYGNGIFHYTFNPKTLSIPAGATMTVKFIDQQGKAYYEHDLGVEFAKSIGILGLLASFDTPAEKPVAIIGKVAGHFDFGWDSGFDKDYKNDKSSLTTKEENGVTKKYLSVGYSFEYGTEDDPEEIEKNDDVKEQAKKANEDAGSGNSGSSSGSSGDSGNTARQDAVDNAIDENNAPGTKADVAASCYINFSFALGLTLAKSDKEGHKGEWYFVDITLVVKAAGGVETTITYVTPIGIPIGVTIKAGVSGEAIVVLERANDTAEYYITGFMDSDDEESGQIPIFDIDNYDSESAMFIYGDFTIKPYLELHAKVGWEIFNIGLKGRADFEFYFSTRADVKNTGKVNLSAYLTAKALFFEHEWDIASTDISLFNDGKLTGESYLYDSLDEFKLSGITSGGVSAWNTAIKLASIEGTSGITESSLLDNSYQNPETQYVDLGDGSRLAVFIQQDVSREAQNATAVYYAIKNADGTWSAPQIIENDGTSDDSLVVYDIPEQNKVFIAWSDSYKAFDADVGLLEALNARDITGVFFDKTTKTMSAVEEVTKTVQNTTGVSENDVYCDSYADMNPNIAYDSETQKMMVYYTKSEYQSTGSEEGVVGDVVNPYSVIAYRVYDFANNTWETYTDAEKQQTIENYQALDDTSWKNDPDGMWQVYENGMYGQRFLNLAPVVNVAQTLDDNGYWTQEPTISEYSGTNDPLVMESASIAFNGLSLYAYVLDNDGDKSTETDRDVYLQIYNFEEDSFTHPIVVTSSDAKKSNVKFVTVSNRTFLAWLEDGDIKMWDVSYNVSADNVLKKAMTSENVEYYYIQKTEEAKYIPPMTVAESAEDQVEGQIITEFDVISNENYVYGLFTQGGYTLKDGIDESSPEAANVENKYVENQIYVIRYDLANDVLTSPVQVTEGQGANYSNVGFIVADDGGIEVVASKAESSVVENDGVKYLAPSEENVKLVDLAFTPTSVLRIADADIYDISAGNQTSGMVEIYNEGLNNFENLTVTVLGENDEQLYNESGLSMFGGQSLFASFDADIAQDAQAYTINVIVKDENGNELLNDEYTKEAEQILDVVSLKASITERENIKLNAVVKNNGKVNVVDKNVEIYYTDKNGKKVVLYSTEIDKLAPNAVFTVNEDISVKYADMFDEKVKENGAVEAVTEIKAVTGVGESMTDTVSLYATADQMARMNSIKSVTVGTDNNIKNSTIVQASVVTEGYDGVFAGAEDESTSAGLKVVWSSANEKVANVYEDGYVEGLKNGKTTITAKIMPANNTAYENATVDNYATLPDMAIKEFTVDVSVEKDDEDTVKPTKKPTSGGSSGGGGGGVVVAPATFTANTVAQATPTPAPQATPTPQTSVKMPFADVNEGVWYYDAVNYAYETKLFSGVSETAFAPDEVMTRAMFVTVLYRMSGEPEVAQRSAFVDVADGAWYADAVAWSAANGIVMGISDTEFAPDTPITREQICAILNRYRVYTGKQLPDNEVDDFKDNAAISAYALADVAAMHKVGVVTGDANNMFNPTSNATRAEVASMTHRYTVLVK